MTFNLRRAHEADVPGLAELHVQTFNETHRGGRPTGPSYEVRERQWRERFDRQDGSWFCNVIEDDDGKLVGFATGAPHDGDSPEFEGELGMIYVLQRVHRQGLGRRLLCAVAGRLLDEGVTSMLLFGEATNPSNGFYESLGAERLYSEKGEFHGSYGWRDLRVLVERCRG
jgi:ribosomal protein S18 acetylase RimI-like enzyme